MVDNTNKTKNCVAYMRYSSDNQGKTSIQYQLLKVKEYVDKNGMSLVYTYIDEAYTGRNDNRPEFQRMISDAKANPDWDTILLFELSRFSRSIVDATRYKEELRDLGINVISVTEYCTETDPGGLNERFLDILNEYHSKQTGIRTHASLTSKAVKAQHCGGTPPLGYDIVDDKLVINEYEAEIVREIFDMYLAGYSYTKMATNLNNKGYRTKAGNQFTKNSFHDLLKQRKYIGLYTWNVRKAKSRNGKSNNHGEKPLEQQTLIEDGCPAIIDTEAFKAVQDKMAERKNGKADSKSRKHYMLGGLKIMKCKQCGSYLVGKTTQSHDHEYVTYYCPNKRTHKCSSKEIPAETLEKYVAALVVTHYMKASNINDLNNLLKGSIDTKERKMELSRLKSINKKISNVANSIEKVRSNTLLGRLASLECEKEELEKSLEASKIVCKKITKENFKKIRKLVFNKIITNDDIVVKQFLKESIKEILVNDDEVTVKLAS